MTNSQDQIVAAFDALALAVTSTPSATQGHDCILAALSPSDQAKNLSEINVFINACMDAAENKCVLMYALII